MVRHAERARTIAPHWPNGLRSVFFQRSSFRALRVAEHTQLRRLELVLRLVPLSSPADQHEPEAADEEEEHEDACDARESALLAHANDRCCGYLRRCPR